MKLIVKHKKHGMVNGVDGETLIEMDDGEKWMLQNIQIIQKIEEDTDFCYCSDFNPKCDYCIKHDTQKPKSETK